VFCFASNCWYSAGLDWSSRMNKDPAPEGLGSLEE
jgi:hypothetical protein